MCRVIISGTGTRQLIKNPTRWNEVSKLVGDILQEHDPELVIAGGAEGFDELLAWVAYVWSIPYVLYLPNPTYGDYYWKKNSVTGYNRAEDFQDMVKHAQSVYHVCGSIYENGQHSNFIRNKAMVDAADLMVVCSPVTSSGTSHAYKYILDKEVNYVIV